MIKRRPKLFAGSMFFLRMLVLIRFGWTLPYFYDRPEMVLVVQDVFSAPYMPRFLVLNVNPLPRFALL